MSSIDADYFRTRALEELERAASANAPNVGAIHQELAQKYQILAQLVETGSSALPDSDEPAAA
jgi:hypothetical protein